MIGEAGKTVSGLNPTNGIESHCIVNRFRSYLTMNPTNGIERSPHVVVLLWQEDLVALIQQMELKDPSTIQKMRLAQGNVQNPTNGIESIHMNKAIMSNAV